MYTGPPESPFWLTTPLAIVNQPLYTASTVPQLSPATTPKWQTGSPATGTTAGSVTSTRPLGSTLLTTTSGAEVDGLPVSDLMVGVDRRAVGGVVAERSLGADESPARCRDHPVAAAMACGERDARLRVDESKRAGIVP